MLTASKRTEKCPTPGQRFSEALPPGGKCLTNARGGTLEIDEGTVCQLGSLVFKWPGLVMYNERLTVQSHRNSLTLHESLISSSSSFKGKLYR